MRVAVTLVPALLATFAAAKFDAASFVKVAGQEVVSNEEDLAVPGDNPLYYCEDPSDNLVTIENVDLAPNPPEA